MRARDFIVVAILVCAAASVSTRAQTVQLAIASLFGNVGHRQQPLRIDSITNDDCILLTSMMGTEADRM